LYITWRFFIKRLVFWAVLLILVLPVFTCKNLAPEENSYEDPNGITYTDVVYSSDGKTVTIYLDGATVPITNRQSRALSRDLAIAGHDYFEVAFYYHHATNPNLVRASWELRTEAHVSGVTRNVDYEHTSVSAADVTTPDRSAAILFVGRKTDKTLLGIGKLTRVDGAIGTTIGPDTRTVTFEVAALESGDRTSAGGFISFSTDYNIIDYDVTFQDPTKKFKMFKLRENDITYGSYKFMTYSTSENPTNISDYLGGIIQADVGSYGKKQPRYQTPDGRFQNHSVRMDIKTKITPENNLAANIGKSFQHPIQVKFDTTVGTVKGSMFAFVFEIPVYPLLGPRPNTAVPGLWNIRASYDSYWLNLDDSHNNLSGSAGGAVLIGTGSYDGPSNLRIRVLKPPEKYLYNSNSNPGNGNVNYGRDLFVDGLVVVLEDTNNNFKKFLNIYNDLDYELGMRILWANSGVGARDGEDLKSSLYGLQTIIVNYLEPNTGITYPASFTIVCDDNSGVGHYTNIPDSHYFVISSASQMQDALGDISDMYGQPGGGTYVLILTESFDLEQTVLQQRTHPFVLIFVAGHATATTDPNIRIGRDEYLPDTSSVFRFMTADPCIYFGRWPFNTRLRKGGVDYHHSEVVYPAPNEVTYDYATWDLYINVNGPYSEVKNKFSNPAVNQPDATTRSGYNYFIEYAQNLGRVYNITVEDHAYIVPMGTRLLY